MPSTKPKSLATRAWLKYTYLPLFPWHVKLSDYSSLLFLGLLLLTAASSCPLLSCLTGESHSMTCSRSWIASTRCWNCKSSNRIQSRKIRHYIDPWVNAVPRRPWKHIPLACWLLPSSWNSSFRPIHPDWLLSSAYTSILKGDRETTQGQRIGWKPDKGLEYTRPLQGVVA